MNYSRFLTRGLALLTAGIVLGGCVSVHREVPETTTTTTSSTRATTLAPAATTTTVQRTTNY